MIAPFPEFPERLLTVLNGLIPEFTLIGSFARDYRVRNVAGLPEVAQSLDVDIAILVPSLTEYRERLRQLDGPNSLGIRFGVHGFEVDVIPYGPEIAPDGVVEIVEGVTLDVTGMAEAAEGADLVQVGETLVRIPTLSAMIGLKLVAWNYRGGASQKDARDLGPLLTATYHGPDGDALWSDEVAAERWDYDDMLVGPYRVGQQLAASWQPESVRRLVEMLDAKGVAALSTQIARLTRSQAMLVAEQVAALRTGLETE